jgi:hypothetical protein
VLPSASVGCTLTIMFAHWSSHKPADVAEVAADLSTV